MASHFTVLVCGVFRPANGSGPLVIAARWQFRGDLRPPLLSKALEKKTTRY